MSTPREGTDRINSLLALRRDHYCGSDRDKLTDLLTDLRHWADDRGLSFTNAAKRSRAHAEFERNNP